MVKTFSWYPTVDVTINGIPALCPGLNCDYTYIDQATYVGAIDEQLLSGTAVTIRGIDLPTTGFTVTVGD